MNHSEPRRSRKRHPRLSSSIGQPPGTLIHHGMVKVERSSVQLFDYDASALSEHEFPPQQFLAYVAQHKTQWVNIYGMHDAPAVRLVGQRFGLHPLVLEDIVSTQQRPKLDRYDNYLFLVLRDFHYDSDNHEINSEQISLVLGSDFVLSFQERPTGLFDPVAQRLRQNSGSLRHAGADALLHALIDSAVDRYFAVVEAISDDIEALEQDIVSGQRAHILDEINHYKRQMVEMRRSIWPLREVLNTLLRDEARLISHEVHLYLRDVYDHTVHIIETLDSQRELISDLLDIYLSSVSNRLNAEVRVLTIVTTLFAPMSMIAGLFGMNFRVMPWLGEEWGFWAALALMFGCALLIAVLFRRRRWLRAYS